jgi:hypothetical protein
MLVNIDHPWLLSVKRIKYFTEEYFTEEMFSSFSISLGYEQEAESVAFRVHSPIEISLGSLDADIGFIDPPGIVDGTQIETTASVKFSDLLLHPPIKRCVVNLNTPFQHQLLNVTVAQRIAAIPPNGLQNDLWERVFPSEGMRDEHREGRFSDKSVLSLQCGLVFSTQPYPLELPSLNLV